VKAELAPEAKTGLSQKLKEEVTGGGEKRAKAESGKAERRLITP
jgi:hypothetical protein